MSSPEPTPAGEARGLGTSWFNTRVLRMLHVRRPSVLVVVAMLIITVLFALVGRWERAVNIDVTATDAAAWAVGTAQTLDIGSFQGSTPWLVEDRNGRLVSNRPPGLIATAVPAYAVLSPGEFTNAPGTLTTLLMTLGAVSVVLAVLLREFETRFAVAATAVFALGTTTWTISAAQLWPHGPGQLMAALSVLGMAQGSYFYAGISCAGAILIRPVTAGYAAVMGLGQSWRDRSLSAALRISASSIVGVAGLVTYNRWLFGTWSISGGYSDSFTSGAADRFAILGYLENIFAMFIGWPNGFLLYSPVIAVAALGAIHVWSRIPDWAKSAAVAGLSYLLLHAGLNRASGGMPIFYRYPLEGITLAIPALAWGARHLWSSSGWKRWSILYAATFSVGIHAANAFYLECRAPSDPLLICGIFG